MPESLEDRVQRLEDVAFEGGGLTRSIDRLGLNANALGEALLQVDRQQQTLTKLGTELADVRDTSATKVEVALDARKRASESVDFRKRLLSRIYGSALLLVIVLVALVAGLQARAASQRESRKTLCESQAYTAGVVRDFADGQILIEQDNKFIDNIVRAKRIKSLTKLRSAFPVPPCLKEFQ